MDKWIKSYQQRMSPMDRHARTKLYLENKSACTVSLNSKQRATLDHDIREANKILRSCTRLSSMAWRFVFLSSKCDIENNFPHTHYDTIFLYLPNYFNLSAYSRVTLLIHEKIHIYQRMYPIPYHNILFKHYNLRVDSMIHRHRDFKRVRINPDTNVLIYKDIDDSYVLPLYNNENATRLRDVENRTYNENNPQKTKYRSIGKEEHPNEAIAYYLSNLLVTKGVVHKDILMWL